MERAKASKRRRCSAFRCVGSTSSTSAFVSNRWASATSSILPSPARYRAVACCAPTLIQEAGDRARPIEGKRDELAALPAEDRLSAEEVDAVRAIGENRGCMTLKGGSPDYEGEERPDRWPLTPQLVAAGERWGIDAVVDLRGPQLEMEAR